MMLLFCRKAVYDILDNRFLNVITIVTIALSILIASAFILFFINADELVNSWKSGIRMMAYLKPGTSTGERAAVKTGLQKITGISDVIYVSKEEALKRLRDQMKRQSSLLEGLKENPLPDAFEIRMKPSLHGEKAIELLAAHIESLPHVEEVEYGQLWFKRFTSIIDLFRLTGYALGTLFFMAAVFIVANTIRIVLYSRREEIEIMRLVGAADGFIKAPFYFEGIILGALGGIIGLGTLYAGYLLVATNVEQSLSAGLFRIRFLPITVMVEIVLGSMLVGWLGCYLSLKQFLKI